ncbi:MAG: META domain-containing protein [Spirochaetaceae bacterium]|nr:META domain-containing protein [Spirochaetaceae bacterium]
MPRSVFFCSLLLLGGLIATGPLTASARRDTSFYRDIAGTEWQLAALKRGSDLEVLAPGSDPEGVGGDYTLSFDLQRLSGTAAPNRYFASYTLGAGQVLAIQPVAATLMIRFSPAPLLPEAAYFAYLEKVHHWEFSLGDASSGVLRLHTLDPDGLPVELVFTRAPRVGVTELSGGSGGERCPVP